MIWDGNRQEFVELDESREWPINEEDGDAGAGLAAGLLFAFLFWGCVGLWIFVPWTRFPISVAAGVFVFGVVVLAGQSLVDRWRAAHPEHPVVDWLRRSGL